MDRIIELRIEGLSLDEIANEIAGLTKSRVQYIVNRYNTIQPEDTVQYAFSKKERKVIEDQKKAQWVENMRPIWFRNLVKEMDRYLTSPAGKGKTDAEAIEWVYENESIDVMFKIAGAPNPTNEELFGWIQDLITERDIADKRLEIKGNRFV